VQKIAIKIVIEIGMEQTRLFQCNRFHALCRFSWLKSWLIFQNEQCLFWKFLLNSTKN